MGEAPEDIRQDIEDTRARMGETVEAIGYKTDVKGRVRESVAGKKDSLVGALAGAKDAVAGGADSVVSTVTGAVPDGHQMHTAARKVGVSSGNPLGLALAGAALGFVVGTLLPSTGVENEKLGERSDHVTEKAKEAGSEALERTKSVAQDVVQSASETLQDRSSTEAEEMASSLREKATEASQSSS